MLIVIVVVLLLINPQKIVTKKKAVFNKAVKRFLFIDAMTVCRSIRGSLHFFGVHLTGSANKF